MAKAPAFQNYAADYYMDTNDWTVAELGIYQRLLMTQWVNVDLPSDPKRLCRIAGCSQKVFDHSWLTVSKKFIVNSSGRLQNLRLEEERQKQAKYSESRREQAEKRWKKRDAHAMHNECTDDALQSSSSLKEESNIFATFSEKWWQAYPSRNGKKVGKKETLIYLKTLKLQNGDRELLLRATNNYAKSKDVLEGYAKDPIRFLKKEFWRDWTEPPEQIKKPGESEFV